MTYLHLLRSEPDPRTRALIDALSQGTESREVRLYEGHVDYEELVDLLFSHERVISWW